MNPPTGRREANKQVTQATIRQAAARLFAEQGYEATTVAMIASAARVGERTFYRYFDSKDDLLADQALAWIDALHEAIRTRPADEGPYQAVALAMTGLAAELSAGATAGGAWILTDLPRPIAVLRRATPAPLRRLERSIADAVLPRLQAAPRTPAPGTEASSTPAPSSPAPAALRQAQLVARAAVAVLRTAAVSHRQLVGDGHASPGLETLLRDCFADLADLARLPTEPGPVPTEPGPVPMEPGPGEEPRSGA